MRVRQRRWGLQPRVGPSTLGDRDGLEVNRNAVAAGCDGDTERPLAPRRESEIEAQPRCGWNDGGDRSPRVASRVRQPWAGGRNPVGIQTGVRPTGAGERIPSPFTGARHVAGWDGAVAEHSPTVSAPRLRVAVRVSPISGKPRRTQTKTRILAGRMRVDSGTPLDHQALATPGIGIS